MDLSNETADPLQLVNERRLKFIASLRSKSERDSTYEVAVESMKFLLCVVSKGKYDNSSDLLKLLDEQQTPVISVNPTEFCLRNTLWLVQKLVREETVKTLFGETEVDTQNDTITRFWQQTEKAEFTAAKKLKFKRNLIENIKEMMLEMEVSRDSIASQAADLMHSQDVVIVQSLKRSRTLKAYVEEAKKKKRHRILSVTKLEEFDKSPGSITPLRLNDVSSKMTEASRVVLTGVAIFPDGSCFVPAGGLQIAAVAQRHCVPVHILSAFYKITPMFIPDPQVLNPNLPPRLPFSEARLISGKMMFNFPAFDLVPANMISLYITSSSTVVPAHVYRLIGDYYHQEDICCDRN